MSIELFTAIKRKDYANAIQLIKKQPKVATSTDTYGTSPLYCAIEQEADELISCLVAATKPDIFQVDHLGRSIASLLKEKQNPKLLEMILNVPIHSQSFPSIPHFFVPTDHFICWEIPIDYFVPPNNQGKSYMGVLKIERNISVWVNKNNPMTVPTQKEKKETFGQLIVIDLHEPLGDINKCVPYMDDTLNSRRDSLVDMGILYLIGVDADSISEELLRILNQDLNYSS